MQAPDELRDWFAGLAMQAVISALAVPDPGAMEMESDGERSPSNTAFALLYSDGGVGTISEAHARITASLAYGFADAMLRESIRRRNATIQKTGPGPGRDG
jgi:hypothetical protein